MGHLPIDADSHKLNDLREIRRQRKWPFLPRTEENFARAARFGRFSTYIGDVLVHLICGPARQLFPLL